MYGKRQLWTKTTICVGKSAGGGRRGLLNVSVTRSGIIYIVPNNQEHSLNFKNFSCIKLVAGDVCKQSSFPYINRSRKLTKQLQLESEVKSPIFWAPSAKFIAWLCRKTLI